MDNSDFHVQETQDFEGIPFDLHCIEHLQNDTPSQHYFMWDLLDFQLTNDHYIQQTELNLNGYHPKENLESIKSSSLEKNDHNIQQTELNLNGHHPKENLESTKSSAVEKNDHNIPTDLNLNGSHPKEHLESAISSLLEKNDHNIPTDLNLNGSHPKEHLESAISSLLEKNDHYIPTDLNLNGSHPTEHLKSAISSLLEKNDHNIPTDLNLNGSHPTEHLESAISSLLEKNDHNIPTDLNLNGSHPTEHLESTISSSLEKNDHNIPTDLNLNGSHPKEHLENTIYFSQCKHTQGREGGKWVVNVIDSDKRVTEKYLTANDIEEDTWVTSGFKIVLEFGTHNQPEGGSGGLFGTWLGKLCLHHPFGITYGDWRKVEKQKKDYVWKKIQDKFYFDASNEEYKKSVMKSLSQKAKYHRNELWKVNKCKTLEKSLEHRPSNIPKEEWQNFVHLQFNEKTKKLRERNKKSRSHYKTPHTLGKKSIARKSKEILTTTGKRLSRGEMFACSRQNANGDFVSEEARDKWVALMKNEKIIGVESIRNVPIASSYAPCRNLEDDPTILRTALHQANDKIATLEKSQAAYQHKMQAELDAYESLFNIIASRDPEIAMALKEKRRQQEAGALYKANDQPLREDSVNFDFL